MWLLPLGSIKSNGNVNILDLFREKIRLKWNKQALHVFKRNKLMFARTSILSDQLFKMGKIYFYYRIDLRVLHQRCYDVLDNFNVSGCGIRYFILSKFRLDKMY